MKLIVSTTEKLSGQVLVPASKSHSIRALLLALLANGKSQLENILDCADTVATRAVCEALGAKLSVTNRSDASGGVDIIVESTGTPIAPIKNNLHTDNSGITTRFILPILGLRADCSVPVILDCGAQMRSRPIKPLVDSLQNLGIKIKQNISTIYPLEIQGELIGGDTIVDGATSQFLSALLLTLPLVPLDSVLTVNRLNERPYAEMTAYWLNEQGIKYSWERKREQDIIKITGRQSYRPFHKIIPGDFSSASYLIAAGVLRGGEIILSGLDFNDAQGDKRLVEILIAMGANITRQENKLIVRGGSKLHGLKIDCNDIPDVVPTLAVIATTATGKTELINVPQARLKETDRLRSMAEGLTKMGAKITELSDGLIIEPSNLQGASVNGYGDHRTVMALALAGCIASGQTEISTAESINKTFPNYVALMQRLGAKCNLI